MRTYELMMITRGDVDESTVDDTIKRFTGLITELGGSVRSVDHWGKRELAYEINHLQQGYYTVVDFDTDGKGRDELDRQLRLADEILRHKIIRPDVRSKNV